MIWKALRGEDLPIYGNGKQTREWIYVEDHAAALLMIGNRGKIGSTFHITSGESLQNIDLVKQLADQLYRVASKRFDRSKFDPTRPSAIVHVTDRPGHDVRYAMSNDHLRTELGWLPKVSWDEGLRRTIQWYLDHPEFFAKQQAAGYSGDRMGCLTKA